MSLRRRVGGVLGTNLAALAITAITQVVVTRALSTTGRGQYDAAVGMITLGGAVLAFGWPNAAVFQLRSGQVRPREVVGLAVEGTAAIALLICLGMWVFHEPIRHRLLADAPTVLVMPVAATLVLTLTAQIFGSIARGMTWFGRFNASRIVDAGVVLVASVAFLNLLGTAPTWAVAGATAGDAAAVLFLVFAVGRPLGISWRPNPEIARSTARYGFLAYAQSLAGLVHERVDILLLAMLSIAPSEIAFYGVAVVGVNLIRSVPEAIGTSAFPEMASATHAESSRTAARLCRISILATVAIGGLAVAISPVAFPLVFGHEYRSSVRLLAILVPASLGLATYRILGRWFLAINQHRAGITSQGLALVLNVVLNIVMIPRWGTVGAALATLISYTVSGVDITRKFARESGLPIADALVPKLSDLRSIVAMVRR